MIKKLIIAFAVLGVALAGRVTREKTEDPLKNLIEESQKQLETAKNTISELFGLDKIKSSEDVKKIVQDTTNEFVAKLEAARVNLDKELKAITNQSVADFYGNVEKKIASTINDLKKQADEAGVSAKAEELSKKLQEGVNTLIEEGKKVADATGAQANEAQKKLRAQTEALVKEGVKQIEEIKKKLETENTKE